MDGSTNAHFFTASQSLRIRNHFKLEHRVFSFVFSFEGEFSSLPPRTTRSKEKRSAFATKAFYFKAIRTKKHALTCRLEGEENKSLLNHDLLASSFLIPSRRTDLRQACLFSSVHSWHFLRSHIKCEIRGVIH